jgi:photosystem II stability/assembly factor-like uncharacterized protein
MILVGTDGGLYTTQRGRPVCLLDTDPASVRGLASDGARIVVGFCQRGAGLAESRDGGRTWAPVAGWPEERPAWSVALRDDGSLLVGSEPGDIWHGPAWRRNESVRAIPQRVHWDFIRPPVEAHVLWFARRTDEPSHWAATVEQGGVLESTDDGTTWTQVSPVWDAHVVAFAEAGRMIAVTGGGLFTRDGSDWKRAEEVDGYAAGLVGMGSRMWLAAATDSSAPLWISTDDGRSWRPVGHARKLPSMGHGVHALVAVPGAVYYGAEDGVWRADACTTVRVASGFPQVRRLLVTP